MNQGLTNHFLENIVNNILGQSLMLLSSKLQIVFAPFHTPWKIKMEMEPKNKGLEDDFPFQLGDL